MLKLDKESPKQSGKQLTFIWIAEKKCLKCKKVKSVNLFYRRKCSPDGISNKCKICASAEQKKQYLKHKDKNILKARQYRKDNPEVVAATKKKYNDNNKQKNKESHKRRYPEIKKRNQKNKKLINKQKSEYARKRMQVDLNFRMKKICRGRIAVALRDRRISKKNNTTTDLIGCTIPEYISHLESLFIDGMTWDNHGVNGWHIDHRRPCASFDLTDPEQQKECFNYKNTQPLWAEDNLKKGATL